MEHKVSYIPVDILIQIFSRVPAKSIARFHCLSKFWRSILGHQDFIDLFLTKSSTRPRLLFILEVEVDEELFVFSSPQPQNTHENCFVVATRYNTPKYVPYSVHTKSDIVCGLMFRQRFFREVREICNHATGEFLTLPKTKTVDIVKNNFGYDPVEKQFKVLCMTSSNIHRVLTLESGKFLWRSIPCNFSCMYKYVLHGQTCITGVLYFGAEIRSHGVVCSKIVCFDVRSEKFSFVNIDNIMSKNIGFLSLINYKGKLGVYGKLINKNGSTEYVFALWVLEDAGNHKWSEYIYEYPHLPLHLVRKNDLHVVGMTITGEMVYAPSRASWLSNPFYVFFYNLETKTFTRVEIQGFEEFKHRGIRIHTFQDYVENIKLYK